MGKGEKKGKPFSFLPYLVPVLKFVDFTPDGVNLVCFTVLWVFNSWRFFILKAGIFISSGDKFDEKINSLEKVSRIR